MTVENMVSTRTGNPVANQFVITGNGTTTFQSYNSTIAVIDWNERTVKVGNDWNYSTTTGKYRNSFFDDNYLKWTKEIVLRNRCHPSIIMWSTGN